MRNIPRWGAQERRSAFSRPKGRDSPSLPSLRWLCWHFSISRTPKKVRVHRSAGCDDRFLEREWVHRRFLILFCRRLRQSGKSQICCSISTYCWSKKDYKLIPAACYFGNDWQAMTCGNTFFCGLNHDMIMKTVPRETSGGSTSSSRRDSKKRTHQSILTKTSRDLEKVPPLFKAPRGR